MSMKIRRPVPFLKDLCTKYMGENVGSIVKYYHLDEKYDPLVLTPFDLIRNSSKLYYVCPQFLIDCTLCLFQPPHS